jgi:hypothetical protein
LAELAELASLCIAGAKAKSATAERQMFTRKSTAILRLFALGLVHVESIANDLRYKSASRREYFFSYLFFNVEPKVYQKNNSHFAIVLPLIWCTPNRFQTTYGP